MDAYRESVLLAHLEPFEEYDGSLRKDLTPAEKKMAEGILSELKKAHEERGADRPNPFGIPAERP